MKNIPTNGVKIKSADIRSAIKDFISSAVEKDQFQLVLMPMKVPAENSYAWMMIKDKDILKQAHSIAPIMPVNAANAIKRYTRKGSGSYKIAAVIRPCELRAVVELVKLNQIKTEDLTLITYDCNGAIPMQNYIADPKIGEENFDSILSGSGTDELLKDTCRICDKFSISEAADLHFADNKNEIIIIANSEKGKAVVEVQDITSEVTTWSEKIEKRTAERKEIREKEFKNIEKIAVGLDKLSETFADCIGCHNCNSVCPICYCRQCYFDSVVNKPNSDFIMLRADKKGSLGYPQDKIMFHVGRMAHMSLSCINCGLCSDVCPVDIPVAKIFSFTGDKTQKAFEYEPGRSTDEALPMRDYKTEELGELKDLVKSVEVQEGDHD